MEIEDESFDDSVEKEAIAEEEDEDLYTRGEEAFMKGYEESGLEDRKANPGEEFEEEEKSADDEDMYD